MHLYCQSVWIDFVSLQNNGIECKTRVQLKMFILIVSQCSCHMQCPKYCIVFCGKDCKAYFLCLSSLLCHLQMVVNVCCFKIVMFMKQYNFLLTQFKTWYCWNGSRCLVSSKNVVLIFTHYNSVKCSFCILKPLKAYFLGLVVHAKFRKSRSHKK